MIFEWFWRMLTSWLQGLVDWLYNIWPDVPPWWLESLYNIRWVMGYASRFGHWVALDYFAGSVAFIFVCWWIAIVVRAVLLVLNYLRGAGA